MATPSGEKLRRFIPGEVIISEVTVDDLQSVAEGYYASFSTGWFEKIEPPSIRATDAVRVSRFAARMVPWISEPHTRWTKATLSSSSPDYDPAAPNRVIGHAGWLLPARTSAQIMNFWRRDASDALGWAEKTGWTKEYEEELWSGTDMEAYQENNLLKWDRVREDYMGGIGHWHLAPLWVLPEYQGRGVASLLLRDGIMLADKEHEIPPMYLEAAPDARAIYRHFGFEDVEGEGKGHVMIRNASKAERICSRSSFPNRVWSSGDLA